MSIRLKAMVALVVLSGCAPGPTPPPHLDQITSAELDRRLEMATKSVPGVVFGAVWRDGATVVSAAGAADLRSGRKVTPETPFAWFSVTKLFTATAVLQLSERGLIDIDAPVSKYLPQTRLVRDGREATVRELLSHSSGMPNPIPVTWIHLANEPGPGIDGMIAQHMGTNPKLDSTPGTKTAYSNLGYVLLGKIVERVSGTPYERYVEQNVLAPLGCRASGFAVTSERATAYQKKWSFTGLASRWMVDGRFFGDTIDGYWELRPFTMDGTPYGGLNGPVNCLLRFARMTLTDGEGDRGRVLAPESVRAMLAPSLLRDGKPTGFGLAWRLGKIDGESYADHDGGGGGYRAELRIYPRRGYAVAVLANESGFSTDELARVVVRAAATGLTAAPTP
jgi:CubicO group peptidase (beta-lactamase class C family)